MTQVASAAVHVPGAVPAGSTILRRLSDPHDGFHIDPLPDRSMIGHGTVDLRLGRTFLVAARASIGTIDVREAAASRRMFTEVRLSDDEPLLIHPQQLVLAATLEYLTMPPDLAGFVQSRSSYGRLGLIAATATYVSAGYRGSPTLELVNSGEVPLEVHAMDPVCHITLTSAEVETENWPTSRYQCATRPYPAL